MNWLSSSITSSGKSNFLKPGILLGAVLLLSVHALSGLGLSLETSVHNSYAVVDGRIDGIDSRGLLNKLDSGGTVSLTWVFRIGNRGGSLIYTVHRDLLGPGYIISFQGMEDSSGIQPAAAEDLVKKLSLLDHCELKSLGPWPENEVLEARIFLDSDVMIPPLSIWSLFGSRVSRSSWISLNYPERED